MELLILNFLKYLLPNLGDALYAMKFQKDLALTTIIQMEK